MDYCQQTTMLNYATGCQLPATQSSMQSNQFAPHKHTSYHKHVHHTHTRTHTHSQERECVISRLICVYVNPHPAAEVWDWDGARGFRTRRGWAAASTAGDMLHGYMLYATHTHCMHAASICAMFALATRVFCMADKKLLPHVSAAVAAAAT